MSGPKPTVGDPSMGASAPAVAPPAGARRALGGAALAVLAVAAALALRAELHHRAAVHADFALMQVQSKPLGPSQLARLLTWLSSQPLRTQARFEVAPRGLFARTQIVTVTVPGFEPARFEVQGDGQVRPADPGGERLAAAVVAWSTDPATLAGLEAEALAAQTAAEAAAAASAGGGAPPGAGAASGHDAPPVGGVPGAPPVRPFLPD